MTQEELEREKLELERTKLEQDRERWAAEAAFREREVAIAESEQVRRDAELDLKREEQAASGWRNPLVVAILAATVAAAGSAAVTVINGILQRRIESQKSESARILQMIKTGDPDKGAGNLRFLLEAGLVDDPERVERLGAYLAKRTPGTGAVLPAGLTVSGSSSSSNL